MRTIVLLFLLLVIWVCSVNAKHAVGVKKSKLLKYSLDNGSVLIDIPHNFSVDREYRHYWDNCMNGGYSIAFNADNDEDGGMTMQVNLHDHIAGKSCLQDHFDPTKHARENAILISDTTYTVGGKTYTIIATQAEPGKRRGTRTHNYHLSYYIAANGHMLELHYNYWDKTGNKLRYWQDMSFHIANSLVWRNYSAATAVL
jgi:hypothetical protein